jgi:hypothetical protein
MNSQNLPFGSIYCVECGQLVNFTKHECYIKKQRELFNNLRSYKMLVKYLREETNDGTKGKPFGVVVAIDEGVIGYSICNPKDRWDKKRGIEIAVGRAMKSNDSIIHCSIPKHCNIPKKLFNKVDEVIEEIYEKSLTYDFTR